MNSSSPGNKNDNEQNESFDLNVEAFNIAAFLKADCLASLERDKKEAEVNIPTLNIKKFVVDQDENEL